ncbi:penicillinase repressor [Oxobacter pfennigii]|uniref:Penicillinase repressor n=1 Tax=Oxobacter pfennigii TaxID=36849 RepID=A0A0N8NST4_9CLOT|nr:BlaI/MecI/CopY family transcriptional regulator [Oxobacter pfennigii]KPU42920.1 penicillinase repressor [Oxobacter pfennigii]
MSLAEKISNAELEIMRILWREKKPISFTNIRVELQNTKGWEKSTINILIRRLADKGAITAQKQDVLYYTPNISEAEYIQAEEQNMIDKLYDGNAKNFVAALCHRGKLSEADIDELKAYFQMGENEK